MATQEGTKPLTTTSSSTRVPGQRTCDGRPEAPGSTREIRRFTISCLVGGAVVLIPYLWVLSDLWNNGPTLLRTVLPGNQLSNFYDVQARAILHGHLYLPNGAAGRETFVHAGRQYIYFGLFPSLIRLPVLLVTHSLDGRLTALSMLCAWFLIGVICALLMWRIRVIVGVSDRFAAFETVLYGSVMATILGGSVLLYLAASPWVYSEDIAWSIALVTTSAFALIGVLERPSTGRVVFLGVATLSAVLDRGSTGYGCVIGTFLAAAWFFFGARSRANRRWAVPTLVSGAVALFVSMLVEWTKFGVLVGLPLSDQLYYRKYLARINHGRYFSLQYLPTGLYDYFLRPGVRLTSIFPFVTLPPFPLRPVGHVQLFDSDHTTSVTGSMPLLLLLTLTGLALLVFADAKLRPVVGIPLLATAAPAAALLIFGFFDNRFIGDFLPLLIVGGAMGLGFLGGALRKASRAARGLVAGGAVVMSLWGVFANFGIATSPSASWSSQQATALVRTQERVADITGQALGATVKHGSSLPASGPLGELFALPHCQSLYIAATHFFNSWIAIGNGGANSRKICLRIVRSR